MKLKKIMVFMLFNVLALMCKTSTASTSNVLLPLDNGQIAEDATQPEGMLLAVMCHKNSRIPYGY